MVTDKVPGCGGILNSTTDKLTSLDLDKDGLYDRNLDCRWNIVVGENKIIILTVEGFDIEDHPTCDYDYLEVCLDLRGHRGHFLNRRNYGNNGKKSKLSKQLKT